MHLSDPTKQKKLKLAELTSGLGALVLGIGLGAFFAEKIASYSIVVMIVGGLSHGWGMYDKNRIEKDLKRPDIWWETGLYWLCWFLLAGLVVYLIFK